MSVPSAVALCRTGISMGENPVPIRTTSRASDRWGGIGLEAGDFPWIHPMEELMVDAATAELTASMRTPVAFAAQDEQR